MYRHKVQDLNSGIVVPMTSYLLGSVCANYDGRFQIEYSWNAGTSLTAVAGSASGTSGGGNCYRGRRAIIGGFPPSGMQGGSATGGVAGGRVGLSSAPRQQFGSARPYDAYAPRWCWFEFPMGDDPDTGDSRTMTRVNINAFPCTDVEWSEYDGEMDGTVDMCWRIRDNGELVIEM